MRARTIIAIVGLGVLTTVTTGCGSDKTATITTSPATTAPTSTAPTTTSPTSTSEATSAPATQLDAKLLAASDVGPGWKVGVPIRALELSSFTRMPCKENFAMDPTVAKRLTHTEVHFLTIDGSAKYVDEQLITGGPDGSDLRAYFDAAQSCMTVGSATPDPPIITLNELPIPALGDQRIAVVMNVRDSSPNPETRWYIRSAIVRVGSVAVGLGVGEALPVGKARPTPQYIPRVSQPEFVRLLETAVAMLSG